MVYLNQSERDKRNKDLSLQELSERKRKAEEEEELNNPELKDLRENARLAEIKLSEKKAENDPLFQFIINSFKEEVEKVSTTTCSFKFNSKSSSSI